MTKKYEIKIGIAKDSNGMGQGKAKIKLNIKFNFNTYINNYVIFQFSKIIVYNKTKYFCKKFSFILALPYPIGHYNGLKYIIHKTKVLFIIMGIASLEYIDFFIIFKQ